MLNDRILRNLLLTVLIANIVLIGLFVAGEIYRPAMVAVLLPGKAGLAFAPGLTGDWLFAAALVLINAALFLGFGLAGTVHAIRHGLHVSPLRMRALFETRAGFAAAAAETVAIAIQDEQKRELPYVRKAGWILFFGLLLFAVSLPLLLRTGLDAGIGGTPLLVNAQNIAVTGADTGTILRYTADQVAGAVLLDAPEIFQVRFAPVVTNPGNVPFAIFILIYRAAIGFGLLLLALAYLRRDTLIADALQLAMPAADIAALEYGIGRNTVHAAEVHASHDHGHDDHEHHEHDGHDHDGHDEHGHDEHAHGEHDEHNGHDEHDEHGKKKKKDGGHSTHAAHDHANDHDNDHGHDAHDEHGEHDEYDEHGNKKKKGEGHDEHADDEHGHHDDHGHHGHHQAAA